MKSAATDSSIKAGEAYTQGLAKRKQAYANAYGLEESSREKGYIVGQQMETMRQNQTAGITTQRVNNAASGFDASGGTKLRQEQSTAQIFETAIANAAQSYAISDQNARNQANQYRKEGDDALKYGQIMSNFYRKSAKLQNRAANWLLLTEGTSTMGDLMSKVSGGSVADWGSESSNSSSGGGSSSSGGGE